MCLLCLTKESKRFFKDKNEGSIGKHEHKKEPIEDMGFLLDSSGISDSSASSDEEAEQEKV